MRHQTDSWLTGDWVVLGTHVPHWAIMIAGLILVALLVAWFERPRRSRAVTSYETAGLPQRSMSWPT
jgi:hypothetical protein